MLKRYVNNEAHLQLEVLYAFQIAVAKIEHPPSEYGERRQTDQTYSPGTDPGLWKGGRGHKAIDYLEIF